MSHETLRNWVRRVERHEGRRAGPTTDQLEELRRLRAENAELRRANAEDGVGVFRQGARPSPAEMTRYIDEHMGRSFRVEPICRVLAGTATGFLSVSGYYARKSRPPSQRAVDDEGLLIEIRRVHAENYGVYGARKICAQLNRKGITVGRDRVERLMRAAGIEGIRRGKARRTTIADEAAARPADLVDRLL